MEHKIEPKIETKSEPIKFPEVVKFLEGIGMIKYYSMFVNNGFEDLDTILELHDEDFAVMGMPLGHKIKIL